MKFNHKTILVTGGAGFIGSHTCLLLLNLGYNLVVLDDFSNSSPESLRRICHLAGDFSNERLAVVQGDIRNPKDLELAFKSFNKIGDKISAVVHFAGLKSVGESVSKPIHYWDVNVGGTLQLLRQMSIHECKTLVFSSSATVYGIPNQIPIPETASISPINPYGNTKASIESILKDLYESEPGWRIACLRYFNPAGAHPSGLIGEDPKNLPNNLFPIITQVASGQREALQILGGDWPTPDGTGIRDYVHVMDLAEGHICALDTLFSRERELITVNLGTGSGYSVLDIVKSFENSSKRKIRYEVVPRRPGDSACAIADPSRAKEILGWSASRGLGEICTDSWSWISSNPSGYVSTPCSGIKLLQ